MHMADKLHAVVFLLRTHLDDNAPLDAETLDVVVQCLGSVAEQLEEMVELVTPLRPRGDERPTLPAPPPTRDRQEALVAAIHCAAAQLSAPQALGLLSTLNRILSAEQQEALS